MSILIKLAYHFKTNSYKLNSWLPARWLTIAITPSNDELITTFGPIPHPYSMPRLVGSFICVEYPVSILAKMSELSLDEHVSRIAPSEFISRSMATSSIRELVLTERDFYYFPLKIFITFKLPSREAQKIS